MCWCAGASPAAAIALSPWSSTGAGTIGSLTRPPDMNAVLTSRITEDFAAAASQLPRGLCGPEERRSAIEALTSRGLPSQRDENWKYVNLRLLEKLKFVPVTTQASV